MDSENGEPRLWAAVMAITLNDIRGYAKRRPIDLSSPASIAHTNTRRGVQWVLRNDTTPGSFLWVCDVLGLLPELVRKKIGEMARGEMK